MRAPDILPLSTLDEIQASCVRGGRGFPASAARDGVGVAEGGAGHGGRCPGGVAREDTRTMPGGEPISLAGLAFVLAT